MAPQKNPSDSQKSLAGGPQFSPRAVSQSTTQLLTSGSSCSLTSATIPTHASGCMITSSTSAGFIVISPFQMNADFSSGPNTPCSCCEYRQYVRGYFKRKPPGGSWSTDVHHLRNGVALDPTTYHEDGYPDGGAYGYRAFNGGDDDFLPHPRATGCSYRGNDAPSMPVDSGWNYDFHLDFIALIVDTCNSNKVITTYTWSVGCSG